MAIDLVRMPPEMSRGFVGALDFGTSVVKTDMGGEERSRTREMPRRYWQASKGTFTRGRIEEFVGFIQARAGSLHAFRFWDPSDCSTNPSSRVGAPTMLDQFLGYCDGTTTTFDLRRTYSSTDGDLLQRRAVEDRMLPISGTDARLARCLGLANDYAFTPRYAINGVEVAGTLNLRTRQVSLASAGTAGQVVTWGGYYDWPARLGQDADVSLETVGETWDGKSVPNIPIECVPFERFAPETDDPGGATTVAWSGGAPVVQKSVAKVWRLNPGAGSLAVQLEEPFHNQGGPHLIITNIGAHAVTVVDALTGATMFTVGAAPHATGTAMMFVEEDVATGAKNWFRVVVPT
jgi:hypothetical protein